MKKIIFSALIGLSVISIQGCMTPMTVTSQPMENISKVIEVNGKKQNQIFNESKMWIAESFKSANNVIQYQDEGTGSIIGKGNMKYPCVGLIDCGAFGNDNINFTIRIDSKDNKARIAVSDVTRTSLTYVKGAVNNIGQEGPITIVEHQQRIAVKLKEIINQYEQKITSTSSSSNNW